MDVTRHFASEYKAIKSESRCEIIHYLRLLDLQNTSAPQHPLHIFRRTFTFLYVQLFNSSCSKTIKGTIFNVNSSACA